MEQICFTLENWLGQYFPEVLSDLNPGCSNQEISKLENRLNCRLPEDFKDFYRWHNGQKGDTTGLFCGLPYLSTNFSRHFFKGDIVRSRSCRSCWSSYQFWS